MKAVLIRVGTDSGCRPVNANGPVFPNGRFEYVPLPDSRSLQEERTYGTFADSAVSFVIALV